MMNKTEYLFYGTIWSIFDDSETESIVVAIKSASIKQTQFYLIQFELGKSIQLFPDLSDSMLWDIEKFHNGCLYFHSYHSDVSPKHQYIVAYDVIQKQIFWQSYNLTFYDIVKEGIVAYNTKIEPVKIQYFDFKTGIPKDVKLTSKLNNYHIQFPERSVDLAQLSLKISNGKSNIESIISNNNELVISLNNVEIERLKISELNSKSIENDYFMLIHNYLIILKNKNELIIYSLKEEKN